MFKDNLISIFRPKKRNREVPVEFYVPLDKVQKKRKSSHF